jgi:hypothetical protein
MKAAARRSGSRWCRSGDGREQRASPRWPASHNLSATESVSLVTSSHRHVMSVARSLRREATRGSPWRACRSSSRVWDGWARWAPRSYGPLTS